MKTLRSAVALSFLATLFSLSPTLRAQSDFNHFPDGRHHVDKKIVGYFTEWGIYSNFFVKNLITSGAAEHLTHINYAFATVQDNACGIADPWADFQVPFTADQTVNGKDDSQAPGAFVGNFHQLQELKRRYPQIKILVSLGGGSADPTQFSNAALPANRHAFVKNCVDMFIHGNFAPGLHEPGIFDGFDVDWEFPQSDADRTNFTGLLAEFRKQLDAIHPDAPLTMAAPAGSWAYQFIDLNKVQHILSFFNFMAYDFDGPWNSETGFVAPLYRSTKDPDASNNIDASITAYIEAGVNPRKIVMGVPFYGYEWGNVPNMDRGLFEPGDPENFGDSYADILSIESQYKKYRDPVTQAPWLFDGQNFWTYDDPTSLAFKMDYVRRHKLGGAMIWELSSDLPNGKLIKTIAGGLAHRNHDPDCDDEYNQ